MNPLQNLPFLFSEPSLVEHTVSPEISLEENNEFSQLLSSMENPEISSNEEKVFSIKNETEEVDSAEEVEIKVLSPLKKIEIEGLKVEKTQDEVISNLGENPKIIQPQEVFVKNKKKQIPQILEKISKYKMQSLKKPFFPKKEIQEKIVENNPNFPPLETISSTDDPAPVKKHKFNLPPKTISLKYLNHSDKDIKKISNPNILKKKEGEFTFDKIEKTFKKIEDDDIFEVKTSKEKISPPIALEGKRNNSEVNLQTHISEKNSLNPVKVEMQKNIQEAPVLDLSRVNSSELIDKISDYISVHSLDRMDKISLNVNHHDLGKFQIMTTKDKSSQDLISLDIVTENNDGLTFFNKNKVELIEHLNKSGIKLVDFNIHPPKTSSNGDFMKFDQGTRNYQGQENQQNDNWQDQNNGQAKRQALWQYYKERMAG